MRVPTRLAALALALALPLALGCGSGSPTTAKPKDDGGYEQKMKESMQKQMQDRKAGATAPTGKAD